VSSNNSKQLIEGDLSNGSEIDKNNPENSKNEINKPIPIEIESKNEIKQENNKETSYTKIIEENLDTLKHVFISVTEPFVKAYEYVSTPEKLKGKHHLDYIY
jgi:hypothetical protein